MNVEEIITRQSRTNFSISFQLLPEEKREAINTVYAFCRCTDDIVDEGADRGEKTVLLVRWTEELRKALTGESDHALLNKLAVIAKKFNIPVDHFFLLIDGMRMDLEKTRYESFDELYEYCYRVASSVGLMCASIFGYKKLSALNYAVNLGIALQMTNILRDVKSDARMGRIYLPREDMTRFGYTEDMLFREEYNEAFVQLMRLQASRAHHYYRAARANLMKEDHRAFIAARIMDGVYSRLLATMEHNNFRVYDRRFSVSSLTKMLIALRELLSPPPAHTVAGA